MTKDAGDKGDKSKTQMPWFKKYVDAYLEGTRLLSPEARGIYEDCLCLIYKYDRELPKDDDWMSHQLHVKVRVWRKVRDVLIACGKLIDTGTGYMNERAKVECDARSSQRSKKINSAEKREEIRRSEPEFVFKNNKTKPQLTLVETPQQGLHACARSDQSDQKKEDRSLKPMGVDDGKTRPAQTPRFVSEDALNKVKEIPSARGWDRQALLAKFLKWPKSKTAVDMDEAFLGWVRSFTNGRAA